MIKLFFTKQFIKFFAVGLTAAIIHWISRIIINLYFSFNLSVLLAYFFGILSAYILNRIYVFPNSNKPMYEQIYKFLIINLSFLPIVWFCSIFIYSLLLKISISFYPEAIAHGIAVSLPMLITFILYKFLAFADYK